MCFRNNLRIFLANGALRRLAFYDSTVEAYASKLPHRLRVGECMHRVSKMDPTQVIASARYVHEQLPIRLARLIRSMQTLPFIMGVNPHLNQVYSIYWDAFQAVSTFRPIECERDEEEFSELLDYLLTKNSTQLQILAKGLSEVRLKTGGRLSKAMFNSFVDNFLREAMLRRLLVSNYLVAREAAREHLARETHLKKSAGEAREPAARKEGAALSPSTATAMHTAPFSPFDPTRENDVFSVFDLHCSPKTIVERAVESVRNQCLKTFNLRSPKFIIDGDLQCECVTIPSHLQYIIAEILKNSAQAVMSRFPEEDVPPPIEITIRKGVDLGFVIADQGGGIPPDKRSLIWSYGMTSFGSSSSSSSSTSPTTTTASISSPPSAIAQKPRGGKSGTIDPQPTASPEIQATTSELTYVDSDGILVPTSTSLSGDGFGLPTARVYIRHLGGEIRMESTYGYGCHCHLTFPPIKDDQYLT